MRSTRSRWREVRRKSERANRPSELIGPDRAYPIE